ncbi:hypothetical protein B8W69_00375 [Mycobacterium vulneris]|uniref:DUF2510 domain-containing protein n=1 Tax=Mycolicibacterium vulneris TaxID=547163 RepID=A0A1X2LE81_9MYCO|nr:DUF2510 domain-containing protein [Mycolicibacterium vulneris]OSC32288.1 hypothetical protein B8W69_00375 [Mycolicibacterium vulneris]
MNASTPQPPAGSYPDPSGKPGQKYWDGQRWRTDTPPPPPRSPREKLPGLWSGLSRKTKLVLAAGAGLVVVIAVLSMVGSPASGPSGPGPGQPARPGQSAAPSRHSDAYNQGYEYGNQHLAQGFASQYDCEHYANSYRGFVARRDMPDWLQGCMDGIRDLNAGPSTTSPKVDCSQPGNNWDPRCILGTG